jgi:hypothetical protein
MSAFAWNHPFDAITLPDATNGTASRAFSVPKSARGVTFIVPDLVGVATTVLLQTMTPPTQDGATPTWVALSAFDLTDGTVEALDAIPESAATSLPATALGGGMLRFVASAAQTGAPDALTIYAVWMLGD